MKTLLSLLGGLSLTVGTSSLLITSINKDINFTTNPSVENHLLLIEDALSNDNLKFFEGIIIYQKVYEMLYKITDESYLNSYMNKVYLLQNKLSHLASSVYEKNTLEAERDKIEKGFLNWTHSEKLNELITLYWKQADEEKENISKLFYAYNQYSSESMIADLDQFQTAKIDNVRAAAQITTIQNQIKLQQTKLSVWEDTLKWQATLLSIYDNMISKAESLESQFLETYNKIFATPEKFFEYISAKKDEILVPLVTKYLGEDPALILQMENELKNRLQDGTTPMAEWVTSNVDADNAAPGDPEESDITINNEKLSAAAQLQIESEFLKLKTTGKQTAEDKFMIVYNVIQEVYRIDDILFSSMHESAAKFFEYVNNQIPRLSSDVKDAFDKNGIAVETKFDEDVKIALEIAESISKQVIEILSPESDVFLAITDIAFGTLDQIENWFTSMDVLKNSNKAIEEIKNIRDKYSQIPGDIDTDMSAVLEEIKRLEEELIKQQEIFETTNEILENSIYDKLDSNLNKWNQFFNQYTDYLDIIELQKTTSSFKLNMNLNARKYFIRQLESYKKIVLERQFTLRLLLEHEDINVLPNLADFITESNNLEKINKFVLEHEGDFN